MRDLDFSNFFETANKKIQNTNYFEALCGEIISQQLSGKAASTIFGRFKTLFPNTISANEVLSHDFERLRGVGLSRSKALYVKELAECVLNKSVDLLTIDTKANEEIINELILVKGIGTWTAEMFLIFTLNREDVFSTKDLGLKKAIAKLYNIENPSPEKMLEITNKWSPYKTFGSLTLWNYLDNS